jgi:hypothetical protein
MADWKTVLDISDLHSAYKRGDLLPSALAKSVVERLKKNKFALLEAETYSEVEEIIFEFNDVDDIDDYDEALEQLYDFANIDHRIWIKTYGANS